MKKIAVLISMVLFILVSAGAGQQASQGFLDKVRGGDAVAVRTSLLLGQESANARSDYGMTVLMEASQFGHLEVVRALLKFKARVNDKDDSGGTALHWSLAGWSKPNLDLVRTLIRSGADVNARMDGGETPLIVAMKNGFTPSVEILLEAGADVNTPDKDGLTPIMIAVRDERIEMMKALLKKNPDLEVRCKQGLTALNWATNGWFTSDDKIARLLLGAGADVNARFPGGATPLMLAASGGFTKIVMALLEAGAGVNLKNDKGETALSWALEKDNATIITLLKRAGAK